jgi:hypothetical protein
MKSVIKWWQQWNITKIKRQGFNKVVLQQLLCTVHQCDDVQELRGRLEQMAKQQQKEQKKKRSVAGGSTYWQPETLLQMIKDIGAGEDLKARETAQSNMLSNFVKNEVRK